MKTHLPFRGSTLTLAAAALLAACGGGGDPLDDASEHAAESEAFIFAPMEDSTRPQVKAINPGAQLAIPPEEIEQ